MSPERRQRLGEQSEHTLDVLWVSTVPDDALHPIISDIGDDIDRFVPSDLDAEDDAPVHGTLTVDIRSDDDRRLLERLLRSNRALSVTASDGWTQRVRLTGIRHIDAEPQGDGTYLVVATYTWIAAASFN